MDSANIEVLVRICPNDSQSNKSLARTKSVSRGKLRSFNSTSLQQQSSSKVTATTAAAAAAVESCIEVDETDGCTVTVRKGGAAGTYKTADVTFDFERVFDERVSQSQLYDLAICAHVEEAVMGKNVAIIATGATRSGKTYTMIGPPATTATASTTGTVSAASAASLSSAVAAAAAPESAQKPIRQLRSTAEDGVMPRAIRTVFETIDKVMEIRPNSDFYVELSFVELRNNAFRNLLEPHSQRLRRASEQEAAAIAATTAAANVAATNATAGTMSTKKKSLPRAVSQSVQKTPAAKASDHSKPPISSADSIEVRESPLLGVFLSRPSGSIRLPAATAKAAIALMKSGCRARSNRVQPTDEHVSSRSHAILTIYIEQRLMKEINHSNNNIDISSGNNMNNSENISSSALDWECTDLYLGKLHLVDLAGIDRLGGINDAAGDTLKEMKFINSSLNSLGEVLRLLSHRAKTPRSNSSPRGSFFSSSYNINSSNNINNNNNNSCSDNSSIDCVLSPSKPFFTRSRSNSNNSISSSQVRSTPTSPHGSPRPQQQKQRGKMLWQNVEDPITANDDVNKVSPTSAAVAVAVASTSTTTAATTTVAAPTHIPYLNSKLTHMLKDSLGGNCRTVLIANVHSAPQFANLTTTTLKYASWAKDIRCAVNHFNRIDFGRVDDSLDMKSATAAAAARDDEEAEKLKNSMTDRNAVRARRRSLIAASALAVASSDEDNNNSSNVDELQKLMLPSDDECCDIAATTATVLAATTSTADDGLVSLDADNSICSDLLRPGSELDDNSTIVEASKQLYFPRDTHNSSDSDSDTASVGRFATFGSIDDYPAAATDAAACNDTTDAAAIAIATLTDDAIDSATTDVAITDGDVPYYYATDTDTAVAVESNALNTDSSLPSPPPTSDPVATSSTVAATTTAGAVRSSRRRKVRPPLQNSTEEATPPRLVCICCGMALFDIATSNLQFKPSSSSFSTPAAATTTATSSHHHCSHNDDDGDDNDDLEQCCDDCNDDEEGDDIETQCSGSSSTAAASLRVDHSEAAYTGNICCGFIFC